MIFTGAIDKMASLLGEDNIKDLKTKICELLIDTIENDLDLYLSENYITDWDLMGDFIKECQKEAFDNVKKELVTNFEEKIRKAIE